MFRYNARSSSRRLTSVRAMSGPALQTIEANIPQEENSWITNSSKSVTAVPLWLARSRKSTLFIAQNSAARLDESRPISKSLSARRNFASSAKASRDCPDPRALSGTSTCMDAIFCHLKVGCANGNSYYALLFPRLAWYQRVNLQQHRSSVFKQTAALLL